LDLGDRMMLEHVGKNADEAAEVHRDVLGLAQRAPLHIEQRGRAVAPLFHIGRERRADQRFAGFFDDRR
jgi:hypothetical protein